MQICPVWCAASSSEQSCPAETRTTLSHLFRAIMSSRDENHFVAPLQSNHVQPRREPLRHTSSEQSCPAETRTTLSHLFRAIMSSGDENHFVTPLQSNHVQRRREPLCHTSLWSESVHLALSLVCRHATTEMTRKQIRQGFDHLFIAAVVAGKLSPAFEDDLLLYHIMNSCRLAMPVVVRRAPQTASQEAGAFVTSHGLRGLALLGCTRDDKERQAHFQSSD